MKYQQTKHVSAEDWDSMDENRRDLKLRGFVSEFLKHAELGRTSGPIRFQITLIESLTPEEFLP